MPKKINIQYKPPAPSLVAQFLKQTITDQTASGAPTALQPAIQRFLKMTMIGSPPAGPADPNDANQQAAYQKDLKDYEVKQQQQKDVVDQLRKLVDSWAETLRDIFRHF